MIDMIRVGQTRNLLDSVSDFALLFVPGMSPLHIFWLLNAGETCVNLLGLDDRDWICYLADTAIGESVDGVLNFRGH